MGKKKEKKVAKHLVINGQSVATMTKEQRKGVWLMKCKELEKVREIKNFYLAESGKAKIKSDLMTRELEDLKEISKTKDWDLLTLEKEYTEEKKMYLEKGTYLNFEKYTFNTQEPIEEMTMKKINSDMKEEINIIIFKIKELDVKLKEQVVLHTEYIEEQRQKNAKDMFEFMKDAAEQGYGVVHGYMKLYQSNKMELDLLFRVAVHEMEEIKHGQIDLLGKYNVARYIKIQNFYYDILLRTMSIIKSLNEDISNMIKQRTWTLKKAKAVIKENNRLVEPLKKTRNEIKYLKSQLLLFERHKVHINSSKTLQQNLMATLEKLQNETESLEQTYEQIENQYYAMNIKYGVVIESLENNVNVRNYIKEKRLERLKKNFGIEEKTILDFGKHKFPELFSLENKNIEEIIDERNATIQTLELCLAKAVKNHNDMRRNFEDKLRNLEILEPDESMMRTGLEFKSHHLSEGPNFAAPLVFENVT